MNSMDLVANVIRVLNQLQIPHMMVGSLSSNLYGIPRSTKDADFVLELGNQPLSKIARELGPGFKTDPQVGFETITAATRYRIQHPETGFMIEMFELSDDPFDRGRFARRKATTFLNQPTFAATAEDVIIMKIRWSGKGGKSRAKDILDIQDVISVQTAKNLDLEYIRRWTDVHGTREVFEKLLTEFGGNP